MSRVLTNAERKEKFESKWTEWELVEFNGYYEPCKVKHVCGAEKIYDTYFNVEKRGPTCQNCIDTKKWYWNVGDRVGDLIITNRRALPNTLQEYQYQCTICGFDCNKPVYIRGEYQEHYWAKGRSIKNIQKNSGHGCACCGGRMVQPGVNDVATTNPDVISYFVNPEDARRYSRGSDRKVQSKCPVCDISYDNPVSVSNLVNEGHTCINCGGAISYPEKMMYFLLKTLGVEFKIHKVFDWSKSVYSKVDGKEHVREYDFYIPSIETIIEMHGSQHYRETFSFNNKITHEEQTIIDEEKMLLAQRYCDHYIVINCKDSSKNYIRNNILQSKLSDLFNMQNIDWNYISRQALSGIAMLVVQDKEKNPEKTTTELALEYGIHYSTVIKWLKKAGIYDPTDSKAIAGLQRSYPIYSPELNIAFRSTKLAAEEIGVGSKTINSAMNPNIPNQKHAGRHPITGERLTWERWTLEQYESWCNSNKQPTEKS